MKNLMIWVVLILVKLVPLNVQATTQGYIWKETLYIQASGTVDEHMYQGFLESFQQIEKFKALNIEIKNIKIQLNSPGGKIEDGLKIIQLLRGYKEKGFIIETQVRGGRICASMCVPIYVQGQIRKAAPAAAFMFHSVHVSLIISFAYTDKNEVALFELLRQAGVREEWLEHLKRRGVFDSPEAYWVSAHRIFEEKSGLITELLPDIETKPNFEFNGVKVWL